MAIGMPERTDFPICLLRYRERSTAVCKLYLAAGRGDIQLIPKHDHFVRIVECFINEALSETIHLGPNHKMLHVGN